MPKLSLTPRAFHCSMCKKEILVSSATTDEKGAPEMVQVMADSPFWFGLFYGDTKETIKVAMVCGDTCLKTLLRAGP